jgi:predicted secreted acid phosphatase
VRRDRLGPARAWPSHKPALELFNAAIKLDVAIFFITGRYNVDADRAGTITNLHNEGYSGWTELKMRPKAGGCNTTCFKKAERAAIDDKYTIIANVGDQWSDLDPQEGDPTKGSYAERIFKVPNPFYAIPRKGDFVCAKPPYASVK